MVRQLSVTIARAEVVKPPWIEPHRSMTQFDSPDVASVFASYPKGARARLMSLRHLILDVASTTQRVGTIEETLKWGQPSYLTKDPKTGTTIRLGQPRDRPDQIGLYVSCQTNLVETFRQLYPREFSYEGDRAILLPVVGEIPAAELRHMIAMALTYHLNKHRRAQGTDESVESSDPLTPSAF